MKNKELFSVEFENFEKIYENYDIFIFDKIKTTALDFARQKKLPCILIPISSISWLSKNEKLNFNKSVFIQEIFRKNNNRIFIDFESLKSKIKTFFLLNVSLLRILLTNAFTIKDCTSGIPIVC